MLYPSCHSAIADRAFLINPYAQRDSDSLFQKNELRLSSYAFYHRSIGSMWRVVTGLRSNQPRVKKTLHAQHDIRFARLRAMNRARHRFGPISPYKGIAFALLILCAQQLLLTHTLSHEHAGADVPACLFCAAADAGFVPGSGPALPVRATLDIGQIKPTSVIAAVSTPLTMALARAPPSCA